MEDDSPGRWSDTFVGREQELAGIKGAWLKAKNCEPQVVSIVAESGFGKTRLAQEFFNWLSTEEDLNGTAGYWPDRLLRVADNLQPNPSLDDCAADGRPMPFLWWGLRLTNPEGRNGVVTSAIRTGEEHLKAHLEAYTRTLRIAELRKQQMVSGGLNVADLAINAAQAIPFVGTVFAVLGYGKTVVQLGVEVRQLESEIRAIAAESTAPGDASAAQRRDLVDMIVSDLRRVAFNPPEGLAAIPVVLLLDDLQWARRDPALCALVERLVEAAGRERWPLLIIATCWEQEWHLPEGGIQQLLTAQGVGSLVIPLGKAPGLETIVRTAFPGLPDEQVDLVTGRADGNPRFLDELLRRLAAAPRYFLERDLGRALTPEGVSLVGAETFESAVLHRLQSTPRYVQMALGLASLQGIRFSPKVVSATAVRLAFNDSALGLREGERPYAFTSPTQEDSSEFRALPYQLVARTNFPNMADLQEAEAALQACLVDLATGEVPQAEQSDEILEAQLALFDSTVTENRSKAFHALAMLIDRATARFDLRSAGQLAELWVERWLGPGEANSPDEDMGRVARALTATSSFASALKLAQSMLVNAERALATHPGRYQEARRARALIAVADARRELEGAVAAQPLYIEALAIKKNEYEEDPSEYNRYSYSTALMRVADGEATIYGEAAALPMFLDALPLQEQFDHGALFEHAKRSFGVLLQRIGSSLVASGRVDEAEAYFTRSLGVHLEMLEDFGRLDARRDVTVLQIKLGDVALARKDLPGALRWYEQAKTGRGQLWREIGTLAAYRDYDELLRRICDALLAQGTAEAMLAAQSDLIALRKTQAETDRSRNAEWDIFEPVYVTGVRAYRAAQLNLAKSHVEEAFTIASRLDAESRTARTVVSLLRCHQTLKLVAARRLRLFAAVRHAVAAVRLSFRATEILEGFGWDEGDIKKSLYVGTVPDLGATAVGEPTPASFVETQPATQPGISPDDGVGGELPISTSSGSQEQPVVARNALCPCGSGERFKHCHGRAG